MRWKGCGPARPRKTERRRWPESYAGEVPYGYVKTLHNTPRSSRDGKPALDGRGHCRRIGRTTRRSTLSWEYRCGRCRCGRRQVAVEASRSGVGGHESMPEGGVGRGAQEARCDGPVAHRRAQVRIGSVTGRPGVAFPAHGAAGRPRSRRFSRRRCARLPCLDGPRGRLAGQLPETRSLGRTSSENRSS